MGVYEDDVLPRAPLVAFLQQPETPSTGMFLRYSVRHI